MVRPCQCEECGSGIVAAGTHYRRAARVRELTYECGAVEVAALRRVQETDGVP